jgi:predicted transposase/invertase (TIGR01784 family)
MPKFNKTEEELLSELDNWFFLLKNLSKLDKIPGLLRKPIFSKLFKIAEVSKLNQKEKMAYDASLKEKWDNQNALDYAVSKGFDDGLQKGKEEEKLAIALTMKQKGMDQKLIAEILQLSPEIIKSL